MTNNFSGAEKMCLLICENLCDKFNSHILCGGDNLKDLYKEKIENVDTINFNQNIFKIIKDIKSYIENNDIQIIHAHDNKASVYAYLVKKKLKYLKIISHIHNEYIWLRKISKEKMVDRFFRNKYDVNLVCGRNIYDYYLENANYIDNYKFRVISNFIDVDNILNKIKINQKSKNQSEKFRFGFVGRFTKQKGLEPFLIELALYKDEFLDCEFILVGEGEEKDNLKNIINKYCLDNIVKFKGYTENPYKYYINFDALFLPSLYEGLPMVILEAMVIKIPIITMNVGSISQVISENTGILVEKENYKNLISELIKIKKGRVNIKKLVDNSYEKIVNDYNVINEVKKIEDIYLELI